MDGELESTGLQGEVSNKRPVSNPATSSTSAAKLKGRACDVCHKRKVKCDNAKPSCSECVKFNAQCTYIVAETPKKITRRRPKRSEALEKRVNELESILREAIKSHEAVTSNRIKKSGVTVQELSLISNTANALPSSSAASPVAAGDSDAQHGEAESFNKGLVEWIPRPFRPVPRYHRGHAKYKAMKGRSDFLALIRVYFNTYNRTVVLFDHDSFMTRFSELDMDQIRADAALWTAANVMCALALRQKSIAIYESPCGFSNEAWEYLDTALEKAVELTVRGSNDLLAIQALLGMTIFLQASPDIHPASTLLAAAIRLVLQNGLHIQKDEHFLGQPGVDAMRLMVQRNRVFWIAYYLDHDLAIRLERPPLIHEDDIGIDLPPLYPEDGLGFITSVDDSIKINFMRVRAHLALVENRIHRRLTSARAKRQTPLERQTAIQELEAELNNWQASSPDLGFALDCLATNRSLWATFEATPMYLLRILYLTYLNCHTNLHGLSYRALRSQTWNYPRQFAAADPSTIDLLPSITAVNGHAGPPGCCVSAARASLTLLQMSGNTDHACTWASLHYHVTALIVLVAHAAKSPLAEESLADIQLSLPVVDMLRRFEVISEDGGIEYAKNIAAQLVHEYARRALFDHSAVAGIQPEARKVSANVAE